MLRLKNRIYNYKSLEGIIKESEHFMHLRQSNVKLKMNAGIPIFTGNSAAVTLKCLIFSDRPCISSDNWRCVSGFAGDTSATLTRF